MILPFWCSSSLLMQRMSVDLPEPEGPQMTIFSPWSTVRLMSRSTWNSPYHLLTPIIWTAGAALAATASAALLCAMWSPSTNNGRPDGSPAPRILMGQDDYAGGFPLAQRTGAERTARAAGNSCVLAPSRVQQCRARGLPL